MCGSESGQESNESMYHFVYRKSNMDCLGSESRPATNRGNYDNGLPITLRKCLHIYIHRPYSELSP